MFNVIVFILQYGQMILYFISSGFWFYNVFISYAQFKHSSWSHFSMTFDSLVLWQFRQTVVDEDVKDDGWLCICFILFLSCYLSFLFLCYFVLCLSFFVYYFFVNEWMFKFNKIKFVYLLWKLWKLLICIIHDFLLIKCH